MTDMIGEGRSGGALKSVMPEDWGVLFAAFSAAYGTGLLSMLVLPFLIGATMASLGLNEAEAGLLGTVEFVGVMVASLAVAPFMGHLPRRTLALGGAMIAILGNGVSMFMDSYEALLMIRPIVGLGCGLALATGNATVSNARSPERLAGQMSVLFVVLMVITMNLFAHVGEVWGYKGCYGALAGTMLVLYLFLLKLPQHAAENLESTPEHPHARKSLLSAASVFMLAAMFLFAMRDTMIWAFAEQIGSRVGYSDEEVGRLLSLQAVLGLIGPLIASIIGARFGIRWPVVIGIIATGIVTYTISTAAESKSLYAIAVMGIAITYFYALSYLTALAAELDSEGRIVAATGSFLIAGVAVGPALAGQAIVIGGYELVGWMTIAIVILTLAFVSVPLRTLQKKT